MKAQDVERLYDESYAASYDSKFLESDLTAAVTRCEVALLRSLLTPQTRWLDVACGTGYFLREFPHVERVGLDLSPAMLERARLANPGAEFVRGDFRAPAPDWVDRFGLVSSMWYAYCYVDTIPELEQVIRNLAAWTSPSGYCFLPLADPKLIAGRELPYRANTIFPGEVTITGILWSYVEEGGKKSHQHLVTPNPEFMLELFRELFERVEVCKYPQGGGEWSRQALLASNKRTTS